MKRGEVWTVSGGPGYAEKPRPAVVVQDDAFSDTASVTICAFTTTALSASFARISIDPSPLNGLNALSHLMVDKVTTVPRSRLGHCIGRLSDADAARVNRALLVFLGLAR
jgi:mRNA interferase MazF